MAIFWDTVHPGEYSRLLVSRRFFAECCRFILGNIPFDRYSLPIIENEAWPLGHYFLVSGLSPSLYP